MTRLTGKRLNKELALEAKHARYHKDGYGTTSFKAFLGCFSIMNGYISFSSEGA